MLGDPVNPGDWVRFGICGSLHVLSYWRTRDDREPILSGRMAVNAGPLTTIFNPPASCLNTFTSAAGAVSTTSYSLFMGHWGAYNPAVSACYPRSVSNFQFAGDYYWSPGVCPQGYTTACTFTVSGLASTATASLCCPSYVPSSRPAWLDEGSAC